VLKNINSSWCRITRHWIKYNLACKRLPSMLVFWLIIMMLDQAYLIFLVGLVDNTGQSAEHFSIEKSKSIRIMSLISKDKFNKSIINISIDISAKQIYCKK
jgi:hypothetical protein